MFKRNILHYLKMKEYFKGILKHEIIFNTNKEVLVHLF